MKVVFSQRALDDLRRAAAHTRLTFGDRVAAALEARIRAAITQLQEAPESGPRVEQRPGMRVIPVGRYPYRLFYRASGQTVLILHIRHTARQDIGM
jgi:addiction module RelE/StbE family toxin